MSHETDSPNNPAAPSTIANPYQGRRFAEIRDSMMADDTCPYPRIVTICGTVMFCDVKGILAGKRLLDAPPLLRDVEELADAMMVIPKTKKPTLSAYQLKGDLERRKLTISSPYISNGVMIAAAYRAGIPIEYVWGTLNCKLGISRRWYREFLEAIETKRYALDGKGTK
jgi:hypothetical protein